jgi:hypothetical protein
MRFPRMNEPLGDIMGDLTVGGGPGNLNHLFVGGVLQLLDASPLMGLSQELRWRVHSQRFLFWTGWNTFW